MTLKSASITALALCLAGGLGFVYGLKTGLNRGNQTIQALETRIAEAKGAEDAAKDDASDARHQAQAYASQAVDAGKRIEELKAKLARAMVRPQPTPDESVTVHPVDGSSPGGLPADVDAGTLKDLIIQAQDVKIIALEGQVEAQGQQIKGLEKALKLADLRADLQAQASKAALDGIKKSRWLGRAEGFAAGVAVGYVGGRVR